MLSGTPSVTAPDGRSWSASPSIHCAVGELAERLPVSRPAVSQHLKVLKASGPGERRRGGYTAHLPTEPGRRERAAGPARHVLEPGPERLPRPCCRTRDLRRSNERCLSDAIVRRQVIGRSMRRSNVLLPCSSSGSVTSSLPEHNLPGVPITQTKFELRGVRAASSIAPRTVGECRWARCSLPTSRRIGSCSVGTSARLATRTRPRATPVRSRSGSSPKTPTRTRVELEHRNLERHGTGWEAVREGVDGDGGWPLYLTRFAALLDR